MKAAVLQEFGEAPRYRDFPDPIPGEEEIVIQVKAVALENIDRAMARGSHFASGQFMTQLPAIVGFDGIGSTEDGRLVGFGGMHPPYGAMAEKAVIPKNYTVPVPDGVAAITAAAVPAAALTGLFPLKWGAKLQPEETVLILGATGFTGKLAVQIAKLIGARRVVGAGRDEEVLASLAALGADAVIDLKQPDQQVIEVFKKEAREDGYHVILDFLWGHPTELLLEALIPKELTFARHRIRLVQIGEMAGSKLALPAGALRTSGLEIIGGGAGLTPEAIGEGTQIVWDWLKAGKLQYDIESVPLKDVENAWKQTELHGKRLVIVP